MDPQFWRRIEKLFEAVADMPPSERDRFLDRECADDDELRRQVDSLVQHDQPSGDFIAGAVGRAAEQTDTTYPSVSGQTIGNYRLEHKLGEGGMGEVYSAEQKHPVRRRVAIKLIRAGVAVPGALARFESERETLALMDHPAIARVLDAGEAPDGRPYIAMEFVSGEPVAEYCDERRLGTRERLELFIEICRGVQHAHQKGIIHRDIKPSNVLIQEVDGKPVPKIIDFGVAKAVAPRADHTSLATGVGVLVGTPEYMSPEQADLDSPDLDTRSDVYSLGVVLYELLIGARPFDPDGERKIGLEELRRRIREEPPSRPSTKLRSSGKISAESAQRRRTDVAALIRQVDGDLDWITIKALAKERDQRYDSPAALAADVQRHLDDQPVLAGPPTAGYRVGKFVKRHRLGVASVATVAALLVVFAVGMGLQARQTARERDTADEITRFLLEMFDGADPYVSDGRELTARELLAVGTERLAGALNDQPAVRARLLVALGDVHASLGLYQEALPLLEEAVELRRGFHGETALETGRALRSLGSVQRELGDYDAAAPSLEQAREIHDARLGNRDPRRIQPLLSLVRLALDVDDYDLAEQCLDEALEIATLALPPDHLDTAEILDLYAAARYETRETAEAIDYGNRSLEMMRRLFGDDSLDVAGSLHNIAHFHDQNADWAKAVELGREALRIRQAKLPAAHEKIASTLGALGGFQRSMGQVDEAVASLEEALAIRRQIYGGEHVRIATTLNLLSIALRDAGRLDDAEIAQRECLELRRSLRGPNHYRVGLSLNTLGWIQQGAGRHAEAVATLTEALEILTEDPAGKRYATLTLKNLGVSLEETGDLQSAEKRYREAILVGEERLGPDHPYLGTFMMQLGLLLVTTDRLDEAEEVLRDALAHRHRTLAEGHFAIHDVESALASCLTRTGEFEEAEQLLESASGADYRGTRVTAAERLVELYDSWGQPARSAEARLTLESLRSAD